MRTIRFFDNHVVMEYEGSEEDLVLSFSPTDETRLQIDYSAPQNYEKSWGVANAVLQIEAVYGIYHLLSGPFIALVMESEARVLGHENFDFQLATKFAVLPLFSDGKRLTTQQQLDEQKYLELLRIGFEMHQFYFSHTRDVTNTAQRVSKMNSKLTSQASSRVFSPMLHHSNQPNIPISSSDGSLQPNDVSSSPFISPAKGPPSSINRQPSLSDEAMNSLHIGGTTMVIPPSSSSSSSHGLSTSSHSNHHPSASGGGGGDRDPMNSSSTPNKSMNSITNTTAASFLTSPTATATATASTVMPLWKRADDRFFWNKQVVDDFIKASAHDWITPMMSAYIGLKPAIHAAALNFSLLLISRRSRHRQGCRFTMRGADEEGNTANFVETEQIIILPDGSISSFVQIRGSIPCEWSSPVTMKYAPKVRVDSTSTSGGGGGGGDGSKRNMDVFSKHMNSCFQFFDEMLMVNLIDKKKDQGRLGLVFQDLSEKWNLKKSGHGGEQSSMPESTSSTTTNGATGLRNRHGLKNSETDISGSGNMNIISGSSLQKKVLDFLWFDFHKECAKMKWFNLSKLFDRKGEKLSAHGFFMMDGQGVVLRTQRGVTRTNCMDNLDRTNVVQSVIARRVLLAVFRDIPGVNKAALEGAEENVLELPAVHFSKLEKCFKQLWGDNADAMSMLYSGTGALKTDFTRTGKRTVFGALQDGWNSVLRYFINNFKDAQRQDAIDLMLGNFIPDRNASPFAPRAGQESLFSIVMKMLMTSLLIFSVAVIVSPFGLSVQELFEYNLMACFFIFFTIFATSVKKETKLGKKMVKLPKLCPSA